MSRMVIGGRFVALAVVYCLAAEGAVAQPARLMPELPRDVRGALMQHSYAGHGVFIQSGMSANHVVVLVDGVRLSTATARDGRTQYLTTIDPERVERVEVVRGPESVLYGSDAIGGMINIVTRQPGPRSTASGSLSYATSDDGLRAHLGANVGGRRVRGRGGLSLAAVSDLEAGGTLGVQPHTGYSSLAGDASVEVTLRSCERLTLGVQGMQLRDVSRSDRLAEFRAFDALTGARTLGPDAEFELQPQTHLLGLARYDAMACGGAFPRRGLTIGRHAQREGQLQRSWDAPAPGSPTPSPERQYQRDDTRTRLVTFFVEPRVPRGSALRVGGDVYQDRVSSFGYHEIVLTGVRQPIVRVAGEDTIAAGRFPNGARSTALGFYAHGARLLGNRTRLLGGVRLDATRVVLRAGDDHGGDVDARNTNVGAHLGVTSFLGNGLSANAHVGQGFRAPSISDLSVVSTVPGGIVLPSVSLRPERSLTYEAGVRKAWDRSTLGAVGYLSDIDGFIDRMPGEHQGDTLLDGKRVFRAANVGRARIVGIEVAADTRLRPLVSLRAQGIWTHGAQSVAGGGEEPVTRIPPPGAMVAVRRDFVGSHLATGWLEVVGRGTGAQLRLSARDRRDSRIQSGGTPGFATLGVRAALSRGRTQLSGGLENLFDRAYREHGSGIDAPGRHVWLRVDVGR